MTSRNIAVFVTGGTKRLILDEPFLTGIGTTIQLKQATVFWKFKNITTANNKFEKVIAGKDNEEKTLGVGYWDFELIKERLEGENIALTANVHDNTCNIVNTTGSTINLKNFGELLGFPADKSIEDHATTATYKSPKAVDVNSGLRYLTITCDLANAFRNVDTNRSINTNIAYLPIPPGTRLNSTVSVFNENHPIVPVKEDIVTEMTFTINSNISIPVDVDVLLNLVVNGIQREYT